MRDQRRRPEARGAGGFTTIIGCNRHHITGIVRRRITWRRWGNERPKKGVHGVISRYHKQVPTKREMRIVKRELRAITAKTTGAIALTEMTPAGQFGAPFDLGIYPQPSVPLKERNA